MEIQYSGEYQAILDTIDEIAAAKPGDRSKEDRRYAVVLTELEKSAAYFFAFIEWPRLMDLIREQRNNDQP